AGEGLVEATLARGGPRADPRCHVLDLRTCPGRARRPIRRRLLLRRWHQTTRSTHDDRALDGPSYRPKRAKSRTSPAREARELGVTPEEVGSSGSPWRLRAAKRSVSKEDPDEASP